MTASTVYESQAHQWVYRFNSWAADDYNTLPAFVESITDRGDVIDDYDDEITWVIFCDNSCIRLEGHKWIVNKGVTTMAQDWESLVENWQQDGFDHFEHWVEHHLRDCVPNDNHTVLTFYDNSRLKFDGVFWNVINP